MVQVIATRQLFNHLTLIAWVKVFRITTEFCIFSLLRGHFSKSCKSGEFSGRGRGWGCKVQLVADNTLIMYILQQQLLPLDDVYYRAAVYTLCRVHSGITLYKSAQIIHKSVKPTPFNNTINLFLQKGEDKDDHGNRQLSKNRMIYGDL